MEKLSAQTVKGYELKECLGEGAYGAVYRAFLPQIGCEVAIKVILPEYANRSEFIRRFETEAQLVTQLEHMHIVPLYDYWREPDGAYLVMRLMKGGSLADSLKARGPWEPVEAVHLVDQLASVLHATLQQGVVHRDLKPANILLDEHGNAYLSDFGIAKELITYAREHCVIRQLTTEERQLFGLPERARTGSPCHGDDLNLFGSYRKHEDER